MGDEAGGAVRIGWSDGPSPQRMSDAYAAALAVDGDIATALDLARESGRTDPGPVESRTIGSWELLATLAAADPTVARVVEPHLDALAILTELDHGAGLDHAAGAGRGVDLGEVGVDTDSTWGVFAAEAPGMTLTASMSGGRWTLTGTKAWCSLADRLSHALITARLPDGARRLFAVALRSPGVTVEVGGWHARGLTAVTSGPVAFDHVDAVPVGSASWYLERPGFAWGGIGVAAVWFGAAVGIGRLLDERSRSREPDQIALMHLGAADAALWSARSALATAAAAVDAHGGDRAAARVLALRTRAVVAGAAEDVIRRVGHALGPAPLALDYRHARRVADLELYLRQHHAERDDAALGGALLGRAPAW